MHLAECVVYLRKNNVILQFVPHFVSAEVAV